MMIWIALYGIGAAAVFFVTFAANFGNDIREMTLAGWCLAIAFCLILAASWPIWFLLLGTSKFIDWITEGI